MIKFENVKTIYSGKHGCMCGCRGKYSVTSHFGIAAANKEIGYDGYDSPNDRSVKILINKLNKLIDWSDPNEVNKHTDVILNGKEMIVWFETDTRNYVAYLMPGKK